MSGSTVAPVASHRMALYCFICAVLFSATSSAPTPLYHLYQQLFHLTPMTITLVFGVYAFTLLAALLTLGRLSDFTGRRPLILIALLLNGVALLLFMRAGSGPELIAARAVQGFATGIAFPTLGAAMLDSAPARGPLLNSVTAFLGLMAGSLVGGVLVAFAPWPLQLIYLLLLILMVLAVLLLPLMPETVSRRPGALAALRPQVSIPRRALGPLLKVTPVNIAAWALGGLYLSLMPTLVVMVTGIVSPFVGASVVATLMLSATLSVLFFRRWQPQRVLVIGASMLVVGVAVTLLGAHLQQVAALFAGTAIAGVGFGSVFASILKIILPLAESHERAGLFAAFLVKSYLAFSLPAILAGLAVPALGLAQTTDLYGGGVILLALVSLLATRLGRGRATAAC